MQGASVVDANHAFTPTYTIQAPMHSLGFSGRALRAPPNHGHCLSRDLITIESKGQRYFRDDHHQTAMTQLSHEFAKLDTAVSTPQYNWPKNYLGIALPAPERTRSRCQWPAPLQQRTVLKDKEEKCKFPHGGGDNSTRLSFIDDRKRMSTSPPCLETHSSASLLDPLFSVQPALLAIRKPQRLGKRRKVVPREEFPYPSVLPFPPDQQSDSSAFRTRILELSRLQKATIHQEQEKKLKRRHSIASFSPWDHQSLRSSSPSLSKSGALRVTFSQSQQRALIDAQQLLRTLEQKTSHFQQPSPWKHKPQSSTSSPVRPSTDRKSESSDSRARQKLRCPSACASYSSLSSSAPRTQPASLRSRSCISLSVTQFKKQKEIKTNKVKRPQSATTRSSTRHLKQHHKAS